MASGITANQSADPLTGWYQAAINILVTFDSSDVINKRSPGENMLKLIEAMDQGKIDSVLSDPDFLEPTETLLLAVLHGEPIEIPDPIIFASWKEIFAAAQVIYNTAVARSLWALHPEIQAMLKDKS